MVCTIVILLCGIPGSGKSTLSRQIKSIYNNDNDNNNNVYTISFDDDEISSSIWTDETFRISRDISLGKLRDLLISINNNNNNDDNNNIIIIDDIMYLHSMRREVYVISRDHHALLLVVHIDVDMNIALSRNATRSIVNNDNQVCDQKISDETIMKLYQRFEKPNTTQIADKHHIIITSSDHDDNNDNIHIIQKKVIELKNYSSNSSSNSNSAVIKTNTNIDNNNNDNNSYNNIIHRVDVRIKKVVSETYRSLISDTKLKKDLGNYIIISIIIIIIIIMTIISTSIW